MFPLPWNKAYRKKDGSISTIGAEIEAGGGGGGGGSFTPDYENDILIIGEHANYKYYIQMEKKYIGSAISGYEIETNPTSSMSYAKIDIYSILYSSEGIVEKTLIKTLVHSDDKDYEDDHISVTYVGGSWQVTFSDPLYEVDGTTYTSPLTWTYDQTVDYVMLLEDPE